METNKKMHELNEQEKAVYNIARTCYSFIGHQLTEEGVCGPDVDVHALTDVVFLILLKTFVNIKESLGEERASELFEEFIELIQEKYYGTQENSEPAH